MTTSPSPLAGRALATPRGAAIAGILFALLYGAALVLIRIAIPPISPGAGGSLDMADSRTALLALNIVPYAGIAFLWFIGVIRDRLGSLEDRFFATVFLGSGLLFLALTFAGAALAGGLLSSVGQEPGAVVQSGVFLYGREAVFYLINIYAVRMAGVFMISLGTIWLQTGLMHRGWSFASYGLAVVLLVSINFSLWVSLIFPGWVLAISAFYLLRFRGDPLPKAVSQ